MANTPSVEKRVRAAAKRRRHNAIRRSAMRTAMKKVLRAVESNDADLARKAYQGATKILAISANKRLITKNKAARHMSRLNRLVREVTQKAS